MPEREAPGRPITEKPRRRRAGAQNCLLVSDLNGRSAPRDQLDRKHHQGEHEKEVDKITYRRSRKPEAECPQHQKYDN